STHCQFYVHFCAYFTFFTLFYIYIYIYIYMYMYIIYFLLSIPKLSLLLRCFSSSFLLCCYGIEKNSYVPLGSCSVAHSYVPFFCSSSQLSNFFPLYYSHGNALILVILCVVV
uniref:Uncharacterized protein n=1 Tax=Parascaris univalens TaxID=6257 RepID=A0A915BHD6_PARUN